MVDALVFRFLAVLVIAFHRCSCCCTGASEASPSASSAGATQEVALPPSNDISSILNVTVPFAGLETYKAPMNASCVFSFPSVDDNEALFVRYRSDDGLADFLAELNDWDGLRLAWDFVYLTLDVSGRNSLKSINRRYYMLYPRMLKHSVLRSAILEKLKLTVRTWSRETLLNLVNDVMGRGSLTADNTRLDAGFLIFNGLAAVYEDQFRQMDRILRAFCRALASERDFIAKALRTFSSSILSVIKKYHTSDFDLQLLYSLPLTFLQLGTVSQLFSPYECMQKRAYETIFLGFTNESWSPTSNVSLKQLDDFIMTMKQ